MIDTKIDFYFCCHRQVPAAIVNVSAPIVNVPETRVTIPAPIIEVPQAIVNVPTPIVNVPQPNVNIQVPNISVPPAIVNVPKNLIIQKQLKVTDKPKNVEYGSKEEIEFDEDPPKYFHKSPSNSWRYTQPPHMYHDYQRGYDPYFRMTEPPSTTSTTTSTTTTTPAPPNIQYVVPVTNFSPTPMSFPTAQPSPILQNSHFSFPDHHQLLDNGKQFESEMKTSENPFGLSENEIMDFMAQNNYQPVPTPVTRFVSSEIHSSNSHRPEILVDDRNSPNIVFEKQNRNRHRTPSQIVFDEPFSRVQSTMSKRPTQSYKKILSPISFEGLSNEQSFTSGSSSRDLMLYQDQMEAPVYVRRPEISHKFNDKFDDDENTAESQEESYSSEEEEEEAKRDEEGEEREESKESDERRGEREKGGGTKKVAKRRIKSISFYFPTASLSRMFQVTN